MSDLPRVLLLVPALEMHERFVYRVVLERGDEPADGVEDPAREVAVERVEQDVREGVIAKLLERLGYEKGTENDILRGEQLKLEYDTEVHGRPKKTDRPITSFPDYILEGDKTWG